MYKEKLIELLKTCDEVKEAMDKLEFWCKVIPINIPYWKNDNFRIIHCRWDCYRIVYRRYFEWWHCEDFIDSNIKEIIWLPLQERFIKMYCENTKKIRIDFFQEYVLVSNVFTKEKSQLIELDNTKDFDNQDDIVYQKLYEAIYNLNK